MEVDVDESEDKRPIKQKPVMRTEVKTEPDHPTCTQLFTTTDEVDLITSQLLNII